MSLRERRNIVDLCGSAAAPLEGVLFSVVQVRGSSYRQPGARMVQLGNGRTAGTISGGCLEADLLRRAGWLVRGGAVVVHFSTAFDDTADVPYGLGCGGEIDVLVESLGSPEAAALLEALQATLRGEERVVATVLVGAGEAGAGMCSLPASACRRRTSSLCGTAPGRRSHPVARACSRPLPWGACSWSGYARCSGW